MVQKVSIPVEVTVNRIERQMQQIVKKMRSSANESARAHQKANSQVERSYKRSGFAVANLSAQINDVGVSLAGGQSPFQVMIQQGTQISQIFAQTGGDIKSFAQLAKGAVAGIINPFSIATFAIIGLGGAALQYFANMGDGAGDAEKALEDLEKKVDAYVKAAKAAEQSTDDLAKKYGVATAQAREMLKVQEELARIDALSALDFGLGNLGYSSSSFFDPTDLADIRERIAEIIALTSKGFPIPNSNDSVSTRTLNLIASTAKSLADEFDVSAQAGNVLLDLFRNLDSATGPEKQLEAIEKYLPAFIEASGGVEDMSDEARDLTKELTKVGETLSIIVGDAEGLAPGIAAAVAEAERLSKAMQGAATASLNMKRAASEAREDAANNLQFRKDPVGLAAKQAGIEFDRNVGDISATDPVFRQALEQERKAVVELATETARLNKVRSDMDKADRERARQAKKESPEEKFEDALRAQQMKTEALIAENEALQTTNPLMDNYAEVLQRVKVEQKLLNDAEKAGLDLTPDRIAAIKEIAQAQAQAASTLKNTQNAQQQMVQLYEDFADLGSSAFKGFITDIQNGKSVVESLEGALQKIHSKLLDMVADQLFQQIFNPSGLGSGGGGGFLASLFGGLSNSGSFIGPPMPSGNAKGGYTGSGGRNQIAGPAHKGEYIFTQEEVRKIGLSNLHRLAKTGGFAAGGYTGGMPGGSGGGMVQPKIQINNFASDQADASVGFDEEEGFKVVIDAVKKDYGRGGFNSVVKQQYGLNPKRTRR